ncbi:MAG: response regulator [Azoarcus sp.]|nr:response regulator [Azoarcus sp.]
MSESSQGDERPCLLLVDDEPSNLHVLREILQDDYRLLFARDGERALQIARSARPDLIVLDVMMPGLTGYEVCRTLKGEAVTASIPVIFVSALADVGDETRGFDAGGVDYLTKPVSPAVVRARVRTHLKLVRVEELVATRLAIVQRLGVAAEYKDDETGRHVIRMSHYSRVLALAAGLGDRVADEILHAAPMHDVGKIGIPDAILRKPGKLDADEWKIMASHVEIGGRIIGEHETGLLAMARRVALCHHEKWDGSGYPAGLVGEDIPIEARIVAIADVFDALTSERPYKHAWPVDEAVDLLLRERGRHFDAQLVDLFIERLPEMLEIRARWAD